MGNISFAEFFKDARVQRNYTQEQFAKLLGYKHSQSVAMIESDKVGLPYSKLKALSKVTRIHEKVLVAKWALDHNEKLLKRVRKNRK